MSSIIIGGSLINGQALERKLVKAFETWAEEDINDGFFEDQFKDEKWSYPGYTERKNGQVAGPVRDIYDLGDLYRSGRDSFDVTLASNGPVASWNWDAKNDSGNAYAMYVHEGLGTNLEPRPWTEDLYVPARFQASVVSKALKRRIKTAFR